MITANQAAAKIRRAIKKVGYNPNGRVRVKSTDYEKGIWIDVPMSDEELQIAISEAMQEIDSVNGYYGSDFTYQW